jgi:hypothetical protein
VRLAEQGARKRKLHRKKEKKGKKQPTDGGLRPPIFFGRRKIPFLITDDSGPIGWLRVFCEATTPSRPFAGQIRMWRAGRLQMGRVSFLYIAPFSDFDMEILNKLRRIDHFMFEEKSVRVRLSPQ